MTSPARIAANRRNAQKSTGPRTPEGKRASSANALKHGLCAERVVVAGEDAAEFKEFAAGMTADLDPVGATETFLCRKIVASAWRLRRAVEAEAALFEPNDAEGLMYTGFRWEPNHRMFALLTGYEARLERSWFRAFAALKALQKERRAGEEAAEREAPDTGGGAPVSRPRRQAASMPPPPATQGVRAGASANSGTGGAGDRHVLEASLSKTGEPTTAFNPSRTFAVSQDEISKQENSVKAHPKMS